jgi:RNA-directed DNA polymerase
MRRNLRQTIYYIEKYGLDSHMEATSMSGANYVNHLRGMANFVLFVNPNDRDAKYASEILSKL